MAAHKSYAATITWTGTAGDHLFSNAANWTGGVPSNGDDLVFPAAATDTDPDNDIVGATFASISFTGTGGSGYLVTGNDISLSGGITSSSDATDEVDLNITLIANQSFTKASSTASDPLLMFGIVNPNTINMGIYNLTLSVTGPTTQGGITMSSALVGTGDVLVNATTSASVGLDGASPSFDGVVQLQSGYMMVTSKQALGSAVGGTTIASGTALFIALLDRNIPVINEPFTVSGDGFAFDPAYPTLKTGAINNIDDICFTGCTNKTVELSGPVTLAANTKLASSGLELKLSGALSGSFTLGEVDGVTGTLNIAASSNSSSTTNGIIQSTRAVITIASGDSSPSTNLDIRGNQTYVVNGVRGSASVSSEGILSGTGTVDDVFVDTGGHIAPGLSPGCLNTGNLTINGTFDEELGGTTACSGYDQLKVTGAVDLTSGTLNTTLFGGFVTANGQTFTIIDNDASDAVSGTFIGLAEGATFNLSGAVLKISYVGGTGNDVVLTVVSAAGTVTAPNTGLSLIRSNALYPAAVTVAAAVALAFQVRRRKLATVNTSVNSKK